jgi:hypothetical protein
MRGGRRRTAIGRQTSWLTRFKTFGVYTVPHVDVQPSGTFRGIPGDALRAAFNASNASAANSTLGRPLAGGAANLPIDLVEPYTVFLPRRNELDMALRKDPARRTCLIDPECRRLQPAEHRHGRQREPELRGLDAAHADPGRSRRQVIVQFDY